MLRLAPHPKKNKKSPPCDLRPIPNPNLEPYILFFEEKEKENPNITNTLLGYLT
jgi:hypothetical protein